MSKPTRHARYVIGENIRRIREDSGKSIAELCAPMGWSRAFWNDLENGNKSASLDRLQEIAAVLSKATDSTIKLADLMDERPPKKREKRELVRR